MTGRAWFIPGLLAPCGLSFLALPVHADSPPAVTSSSTPPAVASSTTPPPSSASSAADSATTVSPAPPVVVVGKCPSEKHSAACTSELPPEPTRTFHWVAGLAPGSCVRDDDNVGGTGFCGEVFGGMAFQGGTWSPPRRWRMGVEAGVGYMHPSWAGYPDLGFTQASGGAYAVLRGMVGYDFTSLFFGQLGAEVRVTYLTHGLDWAAPGVQGIIELGTRVFVPRVAFFAPGIEVGVRELVGCDGIVSTGPGISNKWTCAFADGTTLFARLLFP